ncbi:exodeoxyribonuclease V subunit alpha [Luteimonas sp. MC1572]|uniref:exodeoxyribonuclease V subunit alpha n=1 Tax=Luteimonas sp. MC1572 TaxID=2799325 RepID=UPI0018F0A55A|nr:exodeoxyribonuclease V subunit alpha [Luteimonas sp. MC1572]MBJ6981677.1 exodeoxyribonuclease V subunit alpha [Luteimonas sp. MC1572]QQO02969.1 exodeoxyribonuclease V subunit alpha [Luteimonas sp. MC1572]
MTVLSFKPVADAASLPETWGTLQQALYRWLGQCGASEATATVAAWTSLAESAGHTALDLRQPVFAELPALSESAMTALEADKRFVSDGNGEPTVLVLDAEQRVTLWRNHTHETVLAEALLARCAAATHAPVGGLEADLDVLFQGRRDATVQAQRQAVAGVLGQRLFVLTGGPGTGKTTTVLRMLLMLQRHRPAPLKVHVAAPTGKAAQRLRQALRDGRQQLQSGDAARGIAPLPADWLPALDCIPDREALTLHRLLGYEPYAERFSRNADNPIAADVVVVDEASMVDLRIMRSLFDAVRPNTVLVLVGDADQLTSVAAGSVLMDIVGALEGKGPLVRLRHSFRAEQAPLQAINEAIREGSLAKLDTALADAGEQASVHEVADAAALVRRVDAWARELSLLPIRPDTGEAGALLALRALAGQQLLCALRRDDFGATAINARLEVQLRKAWKVPADEVWYAGRAVLITRNDYDSGLFNGDVGLCLADEGGQLRVWFETVLADGSPGVRSFAPGTLPAHEGAFAVTIHKSQGSEYARVAVVLPPDIENRILSRQLLYTGVSRAKQKVEIWAAQASLEAAMSTPVRRMGGLASKLDSDVQSSASFNQNGPAVAPDKSLESAQA